MSPRGWRTHPQSTQAESSDPDRTAGQSGTFSEPPVYPRYMTFRRGMAIASAAVAAAVAIAPATSGWAETAAPSKHTVVPAATTAASPVSASGRPRGAVEDCSTSEGWPGGSAREFTSRQNLVVGPLAVEGAGVMLGYADSVGGNRLGVHVRGGHRVTLELPRQTRLDVGFAFGSPLGATRASKWNLRNTRRVVAFSACQTAMRARRVDDWSEWPVTGWVGWLLPSSPQCVPLLVWVDDEPAPRRTVIRFGVRSCD